MSEITSFDASKERWQQFLKAQSAQYPECFEVPLSEAGMQYFKQMLELLAKRAIQVGSVGGLHGFLSAVTNAHARTLMRAWIDTYTPIREVVTSNGASQFHVVQEYRSRCNLVEGVAHPFYSLKEKPAKVLNHRPGVRREVESDSEIKDLCNVQRPAISELELVLKAAKLALNEFSRNRSIENRDKLIEKIRSIPIGDLAKKGAPVMQGGLPSLGRR